MKHEGVFIMSIEGKEIKVTDPKEAISQASGFVSLHRKAKEANSKNYDVIYYADAHGS